MVVDDLEDGARMFHSLRRFDMSFPLSIAEVCGGIMTWREIDWCSDQWKDHDGLFTFYLYTCFYRLVLF